MIQRFLAATVFSALALSAQTTDWYTTYKNSVTKSLFDLQTQITSLQSAVASTQAQIVSLQTDQTRLNSELATINGTAPPPPPPPPTGTTTTVTLYPKVNARIHCSTNLATNGSGGGNFDTVRNASSCGPVYIVEDSSGDYFHQISPTTVGGDVNGTIVPITGVDTETNGSGYYHIYRFFADFDISSIPSGSTINSATFKLTGLGSTANSDNASLSVYVSTETSLVGRIGTTPNLNDPISAQLSPDFAACGTTPISTSIGISSWNNNGDNVFTLNSTGLSLFSGQTLLKVCVRTSPDANDVAPAGQDQVVFWRGDVVDTAKKPALVVTYTH